MYPLRGQFSQLRFGGRAARHAQATGDAAVPGNPYRGGGDELFYLPQSDILPDRSHTQRLAYKSIEEVEKFTRDRTKVELFSDDNERLLLTVAIEMRNIYSHNRGNVSEVTLKRLARFDHSLALRRGERLNATIAELFELVDNLAVIARRLDASLAAKFKIRRMRYGTLRGRA